MNISEKIKNKFKELTDKKEEIASDLQEEQKELVQNNIEENDLSQNQSSPICSPVLCSDSLTFRAWARIPEGYVPVNPEYLIAEFMYKTDCLKCIKETCVLENVSIEDPCDPEKTINGCKVKVKRIRVTGCLNYYIDTYFSTGDNEEGCGGAASPGNEGTECIDQVICYTCDDTECGPVVICDYDLVVGTPEEDQAGNILVPVDVTVYFDTPSCS